MADLWHYTCKGRQMDAVSTAEILRLVADGSLHGTDLVWREGMPSWAPAHSVPEVFSEPPVLLEGRHLDRAAALETATGEPLSKRPRWDGKGVPDIVRSRRRGDRQKQMVILWVGLFAGGALLLIVFVLGLIFIAFSAL